ncbi:MAG: ATP-dependent Clp protease ATP-binding subunit ClpC [Patescibacteria group bacterium]|jgi:ATP-dependent Clp protease ATP-binding subunit ClpC
MKTIHYPLLCYPLQKNAVLGILVGTEFQVVEPGVKQVKSILNDHLQRMYKKEAFYPYIELEKTKLKTISVKIRPTYQDDSGRYPLSQTIQVPVSVVYGQTEDGLYECYLPLFDESFFYYDPKQFNSLVQHFAAYILNDLSPEQLYQHMGYPEPTLEYVDLRINEDREWKLDNRPSERRFEMLNRLAVRYPDPAGSQRTNQIIPDVAWEMEDKVEQVVDKIKTANLLLVGNHGVGKSAVLKQAMRKVNTQSKKLKAEQSFWQLLPRRITSSAKFLGQWEENCEVMVEELQSANGVLWVIDVVQLLQIGGRGPETSVAAFLMPFLQSGTLQIISEVTEKELESMRRMLPGFAASFQIVKIPDMPEQKVQKVMDHFANYVQKSLKISLSQKALSMSYRLLKRYYPYQSFPGKVIPFLTQCVSTAQQKGTKQVGFEEVVQQFIQRSGLPELFLRDDLLLDTKELDAFFSERIIGQPEAVKKMASVVKVFKAGLNNPGKPISTLIFAGPTGVGKTACAKALADYFFGKGNSQSPLIRIDMSEFQHPYQMSRLIGSGREPGQLIQNIRQRPFAVILLDEIEKANPAVFDALMTMLDEGVMLDNFGRVTNFRNTIIIMTSNLGASNQQGIGFSQTESPEAAWFSAIKKFFRPEFVNRIDSIVPFNNLKPEDIKKICLKELEEVKNREGFVKLNLTLEFTDALVDHITNTGFDKKLGARPLQRAIDQLVIGTVANWLLEHPEVGNQRLLIDSVDGKVVVG